MDALNDVMARGVIDAWVKVFQSQKVLADGAIGQLSDSELHRTIAPGTNSAATIMNHMAGNMASRWTDWLSTDGEKPGRCREDEFRPRNEPRSAVLGRWNAGWTLTLSAARALRPEDLRHVVTIRGEPHSVPDAVNRQVSHYGYHVGQILLIARVIKGRESWRWLTVPPEGSAAFNTSMKQKYGEWDPSATDRTREPTDGGPTS